MTASVSLNQFVCLRQPASDYLSECYQISELIKNLIEDLNTFLNAKSGLPLDDLTKSLEMFLESFQINIEEAHSAIDAGENPYLPLLSLNVRQLRGESLLREVDRDLTKLKHMLLNAADELNSYDGFELYDKELAKVLNKKKGESQEVAHG
ncbi:MAG: hypothetical protein REH83_02615 [Rickettsiella sp.]|nr:hypothetical protein [Rickettsiella sp.]